MIEFQSAQTWGCALTSVIQIIGQGEYLLVYKRLDFKPVVFERLLLRHLSYGSILCMLQNRSSLVSITCRSMTRGSIKTYMHLTVNFACQCLAKQQVKSRQAAAVQDSLTCVFCWSVGACLLDIHAFALKLWYQLLSSYLNATRSVGYHSE